MHSYCRNIRASSEVALDRSSVSRYSRATSVAPGTSLAGYTGYYGRQLALHRQSEEARRAEASAAAAAASSSRMAAAAASSCSMSAAMTAASKSTASVSKTTTKVEAVRSTVEKEVSTSVEQSRDVHCF